MTNICLTFPQASGEYLWHVLFLWRNQKITCFVFVAKSENNKLNVCGCTAGDKRRIMTYYCLIFSQAS